MSLLVTRLLGLLPLVAPTASAQSDWTGVPAAPPQPHWAVRGPVVAASTAAGGALGLYGGFAAASAVACEDCDGRPVVEILGATLGAGLGLPAGAMGSAALLNTNPGYVFLAMAGGVGAGFGLVGLRNLPEGPNAGGRWLDPVLVLGTSAACAGLVAAVAPPLRSDPGPRMTALTLLPAPDGLELMVSTRW